MQFNKETKQLVRQYLLKGLAWSVPALLTIWLVSLVFNIADKFLGPVTSMLLRTLLPDFLLVGPFANGESSFVSFLLMLLLLTVLGAFVSWRYGERIVRGVESLIVRIPGIGFVYRNTRKMAEFFDGSKNTPFERVVLVPYPHKDVLTIAFVAGHTLIKWGESSEESYLKVVVPNPPTGVQGIVLVPERMAVDTSMTVEEGLQHYVSLGMVSPAVLTVSARPADDGKK
jgi:uncharacterized membrane protein